MIYEYGFLPWAAYMETTPVLPKFYWDVESLEQRYLKLCQEIERVKGYLPGLEKQVYLNRENIEVLNDKFHDYLEGGFDDFYRKQIDDWVNENVELIFDKYCKMVFFGLTDDGYFCAYVPQSMSDIEFDTGMVYGTSEYGRLILRYNVDGEGVINNTNKPSENYSQLINEVKNLKKIVDYNSDILKTPLKYPMKKGV